PSDLRVLNRPHGDGCVEPHAEELGALLHQFPSLGVVLQPAHPGVGQVRAGRVGNHEIPAIEQHIPHVALVVRAGGIRGQQVAGHGVMPTGKECVTNHPAVLAGHKHSHSSPSSPASICPQYGSASVCCGWRWAVEGATSPTSSSQRSALSHVARRGMYLPPSFCQSCASFWRSTAATISATNPSSGLIFCHAFLASPFASFRG